MYVFLWKVTKSAGFYIFQLMKLSINVHYVKKLPKVAILLIIILNTINF